jgi:ATP-dependent exoDNAse (exonuclease V) beta subunit
MQPEQDAEHLLAMFRKCRADRPALVATLTAAAARGKLFHEIPIRYRTGAGEQVSGDIDLLWHDQDGWHILDYKAGAAVPTADAPLQSATLIKHHAQVSCYAEGVGKLVGEPVADYGIWYTRYGLVVRWRAAAA